MLHSPHVEPSLNSIPTETLYDWGDGKCPRFLLAYISTITRARIVIQVCIKNEFHTFNIDT